MKFKLFLVALLFSPIALAATPQDEVIHSWLPNGTTAPDDSATQRGSELSSLPASITRYMENRKKPEAKASDTYEAYGSSLCSLPGFKCIRVTPNENWFQLWPNEHKREIIMRLNRTNVALKYRHYLVVPNNLNSDYMSYSPLPERIKPTGHKVLMIDLRLFAFGAYNAEGDLVYWGPATGGKKWCSDTKEDCESVAGKYKIYRIQGENCKSSKYPLDERGGAPMPYCMHYYKGYAIHGSTLSGFNNRSRGCIRLFYSDAKWLNQDFVKLGTEVIVKR